MNTEPKRLYELPRDAGIKIHYGDLLVEFKHLDGMYSYCTILEGASKGKPFHLSVNTPLVEIGEKEYEVPLQ